MGKCPDCSDDYVEKSGVCPLFLALLEISVEEIYKSNDMKKSVYDKMELEKNELTVEMRTFMSRA
jgi:hypothetical protein